MIDLQANGWTNPHAFQCVSRRCRNDVVAQLPYFAQAAATFFGASVLLLMVQFVALALRGFDDVFLEEGRVTHASHPWLGTFHQADLRFVERMQLSTGSWPTIHLGWVNVVYRVNGAQRGVTIMTWLYRESEETILSNFEAAGFEVRRPDGDARARQPIWDRDPTD